MVVHFCLSFSKSKISLKLHKFVECDKTFYFKHTCRISKVKGFVTNSFIFRSFSFIRRPIAPTWQIVMVLALGIWLFKKILTNEKLRARLESTLYLFQIVAIIWWRLMITTKLSFIMWPTETAIDCYTRKSMALGIYNLHIITHRWSTPQLGVMITESAITRCITMLT